MFRGSPPGFTSVDSRCKKDKDCHYPTNTLWCSIDCHYPTTFQPYQAINQTKASERALWDEVVGCPNRPKSELRRKPTVDDGLQTYHHYAFLRMRNFIDYYQSASQPIYAMGKQNTVSWRIGVAKLSHDGKVKLQYRDRCNPSQFPSRIDSETKRCLKLDSPPTWHASVSGPFLFCQIWTIQHRSSWRSTLFWQCEDFESASYWKPAFRRPL